MWQRWGFALPSACMGATPPTQRLKPHRIGRLYSFPGPIASIFPHSITRIGESAFEECTSLADVYYNGTKNQWDDIVIDWHNECLTNSSVHYLHSSSEGTFRSNVTLLPDIGAWVIDIKLQTLHQDAIVVCGVYTQDGKQLDVKLKTVEADSKETTVTMNTLEDGAYVKVFLLSTDYVPLDECVKLDIV